MKKFICIILSLLFVTSCMISVSAADAELAETGKTLVTYGDWVYERISGDRYWEIDSYVGEDTELVVPRIVNDVMVVSLSDYCFNGDTSIKSIETSSPLWNIGEYAFSGCTNLENVELNFALQTIGVGAFVGTHSLKSINLEASVVTEIKAHTFMNSGIEEVSLPDTCEKIGNYAFGQCASLRKITIPASVTEIHQDAFKGSDSVVIYCYTGSAAHDFALANEIPYVLLDGNLGVSFGGCTLSLTEFIGVNYYMELSDELRNDADAVMRFRYRSIYGMKETQIPLSEGKVKTVNGQTYYVFRCSVSACEMAEDITAQVISGQQLSSEYVYSVKRYADYILNNAQDQTYAPSVPLVKAMLNYGAYSQIYFSENGETGTLANEAMTAQDKILGQVDTAALEAEYAAKTDMEEVDFIFEGSSLSLKSETTLSLFFTSSEPLVFSCTHDELGDMTINSVKSDNYRIARIRGILPMFLGDSFLVNVRNVSSQLSGFVTFSPMYYCATVMNNDNNPEEYRDVCMALYWYYVEAKEYFLSNH